MAWIRGLLLCVACCLALPVWSQTPFPRVDEASTNPDFLAFRDSVLKIIERRDADAIMTIASPNIHFSFGDVENGPVAFRAGLNLDDPRSSFWPDLQNALQLGGRFDSAGVFTAPYVFTDWPDAVDLVDYMAVTGRNVRVRAAPNVEAETLATLSHCLVQAVQPSGKDDNWYQVRLQDGREGHIHAQYLRSPLDHRAAFESIHGQWKMIFFIAGD